MDGSSYGREAIALPPRPEREVQRVTSKVGMEPTRPFWYIFPCSIALRILGSHYFSPWLNGGFDHGAGHSLLLLYDEKASHGQKSKEFKGLG